MNKHYIVCYMMTSLDGRAEIPSLFEGRTEAKPLALTLEEVRPFDSGAVLIKYRI